METVQDKIDEMLRDKSATDIVNMIAQESNSVVERQMLIGQIMRENQNDVTDYVEKIRQETKQMQEAEIEKEINQYKNSPYYYNYINFLHSIDSFLIDMYYKLLSKYNYNSMTYNDPFIEKYISSTLIQNVGFPLPEFFYNEMLETIQNKINAFPLYSDLEFAVEIKPIQYAKVGNVYRNYDAYMLNIELRTKQKQKTLV